MESIGKTTQEVNYSSARIHKLLGRAAEHALTVIEASAGFGKTTAMRMYLDTLPGEGAQACWCTCRDEPANINWEQFCSAFAQIDEKTANALRRVGTPQEETLADIAHCLRACTCDTESFLVVDNYQFLHRVLPPLFLEALSIHSGARLHIVVLTQWVNFRAQRVTHNNRILHIEGAALQLSRAEAGAFFEQAGIALPADELDSVCHLTEGWVAALNLQRLHYRQKGRFGATAEIESLIRLAIWNPLSQRERDFLVAVSLLEDFTREQARIVLGEEALPAYAAELLENNTFIRYSYTEEIFTLHSLLRGFLEGELAALPAEKREHVWRRTGVAYAARGKNYHAARCFYHIRDDQMLMEVPLRGDELGHYIDGGAGDFLVEVIDNCPEELLLRHPRVLLVYAFELFALGNYEYFGRLCEMVGAALAQAERYGLDEQTCRTVGGEFALLMSFPEFNDIQKMSVQHRAAWEMLAGASNFYEANDSWTFAQPTVLGMYWSESGVLARILEDMDECMPIYRKLVPGHGAGAEVMIRAEALLMQGDCDSAEALCHKTLYLASSSGQDSLCFAAYLALARVEMLRGNEAGYREWVEKIQQLAETGTEFTAHTTADLALGFLAGVFEFADQPVWLQSPELIEKKVYEVTLPFAFLVHLQYLFASGMDGALAETARAILPVAQQQRFVLIEVYCRVLAAAALLRLGDEQAAAELLKPALETALPDKVYLPFAEYYHVISPLLGGCGDLPGMRELTALAERHAAGRAQLMQALCSEGPVLTPRETEVAQLAANGLSNKQIAMVLFISPDTVKTILKRVFGKLGIRSRAQLPQQL